MAHDVGVAFVGTQQAGEHGDGGGLTGAIGAEKAEYLARFHGKADSLYGLVGSKRPVKVAYFDCRHSLHFHSHAKIPFCTDAL
jgi:ATPase subunit of ABC transporter with duplicated ATPase domains